MLILAGVAISISTNSGDIFGKASQAREVWNSSVEKEEKSLLSYIETLENVTFDIPNINVDDIDPNSTELPEKKTIAELPGYIPIYTIEQLQKVATNEQLTIEGTTYTMAPSAKYALMNDLSNITMQPIAGFTGEFEGNGCTISNLNIDTTSRNKDYKSLTTTATNRDHPAGLFECVINGTVKNLLISNATINSVESAGGIAGQGDNVTIDNCYVVNSTLNGEFGSSAAIVGFLGNNGGTISRCKVVSTKVSEDGHNGTAICHTSFGAVTINDCEVVNSSNTEIKYSSGIIHYCRNNVTINNCKVQNIVVTLGGGICGFPKGAGMNYELNINNCSVKDIKISENANSAICSGSGLDTNSITNCNVQGVSIDSNISQRINYKCCGRKQYYNRKL